MVKRKRVSSGGRSVRRRTRGAFTRTKPKRRTYVKRRYKRKRKLPRDIPNKLRVRMTYGTIETLNPASDFTAYSTQTNGLVRTFTWTPNNLNSLHTGGSNPQPYEAAEWSNFYTRYRVKGYKVSCWVQNAVNGVGGVESKTTYYIVGHQSNSSLPVCNPTDTSGTSFPNGDRTWDKELSLLRNKKLKARIAGPGQPAYNGGLKAKKLTQLCSPDAILNQERIDIDDRIGDMTKASGSPPVTTISSPANIMYHHVSVRLPFNQSNTTVPGTADDITIHHRIELDVELFDKRTAV